ncbi:hypothetical protein HFN78_35675 [Rhizobium laguerreae]|uniref:hypothetical protein n=1 Tax=Rhizobium TaxID=379 RepID=UPI00035E02DB|nr:MULTISPECIES: hypothetical protein [Rhizobium]MBY3476169.1 hypothetical protein [Rhizobium laguerreae]MBY3521860.1 hypothetical protein [Rhizobium laguerreae]TBD89431.1 hypothetical protein ELH14_07005 [Rhizobium ruizarguesonis]TBZ72486.1 hypothetical protein E0H43_17340 [Rhizobium leguminosarum bv. viciae]UFW79622.1 hypothetical protein RlegSU303_06730 [Rhizobium leguminosarum bv. viciae]
MTEVKASLADVRAAYRLIWAYQKRALDTVRLVQELFRGVSFKAWRSNLGNGTPASHVTPFGRDDADFLPIYGTSFLFAKPSVSPGHPREGDWMLEIRIVTDDGINKHLEQTPLGVDPFDKSIFVDPAEAKSLLILIVWKSVEDQDEGTDWVKGIWNYNEWPSDESKANGDVMINEYGSIHSFQVEVPLHDLASRADIEAFVRRSKLVFKDKLGLDIGL